MAYTRKFLTPLSHLLRKNESPYQLNTVYRSFCTLTSLPFRYSNQSYQHQLYSSTKRFFGETPHEFFPRVLATYKPTSTDLTKEQLISELKTSKVSFERGKTILLDLLYMNKPFTTAEMETIIQVNMKLKNYIRIVSFADYCINNKLMPEMTETTADYILYSCAELHDGTIIKQISRYLPNYIKEKYAFKSKLLRSYYTCHMKKEGDALLALFERNNFRFSDCNNNILDGLYEGGYYTECISLYQKIEGIMKEATAENPLKLYHRGYFAVLKSYCKMLEEEKAVQFIQTIKQQQIYLDEDCYFCLCEMYDSLSQWEDLSKHVLDVFQEKGIPVSDIQKKVIIAGAKELQYKKGVTVMNEYCETHGSSLSIDKKERRLVLQCLSMPPSACRMRVLKFFNDINTSYRYQSFDDMVIAIRASQEQPAIIQLLEKDLYPTIRYTIDGVVITLNNGDILKWLDRKQFNFQYFK